MATRDRRSHEIEMSEKTRRDIGQGPMTPMHPEEATIGRLEREMGETPDLVRNRGALGHTVASGDDMTADEREHRGIIDESRHDSSIGTR